MENTVITKRPTIFISYSWDSDEHKKRVFDFSQTLRDLGLETRLDQYQEVEQPPEGWPQWMANQIEEADFVLMVCTESYHRRATSKEELGKGKGVTWEGSIMKNIIYQANANNTKFIPLIFSGEEQKYIPNFMAGIAFYQVTDDGSLTSLYRRLTKQERVTAKPVGDIVALSTENEPKHTFALKK
jgi:hypothetical protein